MENIKLNCDVEPDDYLKVSLFNRDITVMTFVHGNGQLCYLTKQQAAQLRDWLNEFLNEGE